MPPGGWTSLDLGGPLRPRAGHGVSRHVSRVMYYALPTKRWGFTACKPIELSKHDVSGRILYLWEVRLLMFMFIVVPFHVECRKPTFP